MSDPHGPIALIFDTFGPYHLARLRAAQAALDVVGIEIGSVSDDYGWFESQQPYTGRLVSLFGGQSSGSISHNALRATLFAALDRIAPGTVAVPGWGTMAALVALEWCVKNDRPAILMCDSTAMDAPRRFVPEAVKAGIVSLCAAGFVSGSRSAAYLLQLGLSSEHIHLGYDVVDNHHFRSGAARALENAEATRSTHGLPQGYILSLGRLVEKKNLDGLLRGYAAYVLRAEADAAPLVIAGSGTLEPALRDLANELCVADRVTFAGHVSYDALPSFYALAACFALVSTVEQWGLVVNEAIACGLPILVSERCGVSADLVLPGRNGLVCAPDPQSISDCLLDLLHRPDAATLSQSSLDIAAAWDLDRFVAGLSGANRTARSRGRSRRLPPFMARLLLHLAMLRVRKR